MDVKNEDGKKERLFLYYDGESVSGKVGVFPLLQLTCIYLWWFFFFVYNSIEADGSTNHHSLIYSNFLLGIDQTRNDSTCS